MGLASVSRESCENILSKGGRNGEGMGRAITIVIGGARESLESKPGTLRLVVRRRKGQQTARRSENGKGRKQHICRYCRAALSCLRLDLEKRQVHTRRCQLARNPRAQNTSVLVSQQGSP